MLSGIANPSVAAAPRLIDGDDSFSSVNMKLSRELLQPGTLALAINKRLRFGSADTRNGCRCLPVALGSPLMGSGVGIDSRSGSPVLSLIGAPALQTHVTVFNPNSGALAANVAAASLTGYIVDVIPAFGQTILSVRNPLSPAGYFFPFAWDGSDPAGFQLVVSSNPGDTSTERTGCTGLPEVVENRLVYARGYYTVVWTLSNDYTRNDKVYGLANAKRDVGGNITRIFPTLQKTLLVFKERAIVALVDFTGNLGGLNIDGSVTPPPFSIQDINPTIGCTAPHSVVQVGADVFFLSSSGRGVYRLSAVLQDRIAVLPDPVTLPLQPLIDRINWAYADGACAAPIGEYVFFAVPIDGSQVNNCIVAFNAATNQLEGYDTWGSATQFDRLYVLPSNGTPHLYGVDHSAGRVWLMYDETLAGATRYDVFPGGNVAIADTIETRGYATAGLNGAGTRRKKFKKLRIAIATQHPSVTLTAIADGVNEEKVLRPAPITRSSTRSMLFDNDGSNAAAPLQEDYASGATQESIVRRNVDMSGRSLSIRIANTQGTCNLRSVHLEAKPLPNMTEAGA